MVSKDDRLPCKAGTDSAYRIAALERAYSRKRRRRSGLRKVVAKTAIDLGYVPIRCPHNPF